MQRSEAPGQAVPFRDAVLVWVRVALQSFGGPAGQIAVMHRVLVEEKRWLSEERFLHALSFCTLLPGPEAQQLATYTGWLLNGTRGGIVAGTLFVLPGFLSILALSVVYVLYQHVTLVQGVFFGLKAAVLAVVLEAVVRIGRRALKHPLLVWLAALAFIAIFFLNVPFPLVVLGAGVIGFVGSRVRPDVFKGGGHGGADGTHAGDDDAVINARTAPRVRPSWRRTLRVSGVGLAVWFGPLLLVGALFGWGSVFWEMAKFFSVMAVVTFGGAYAVLAYVAQQAVQVYHWLQPGEMLNGLGMAETTPGPLIQVVQYVGFLGAYRQPEGLAPLVAGALASVVVTWATFAPCFLWIFLGAPYIERLRGNRALTGALTAITAAVVGVIVNLSAWFALNTVFREVSAVWFGPVRLYVPAWSTVDVPALLLAALSAVALLRFKLGTVPVLAASAALGAAYALLTR